MSSRVVFDSYCETGIAHGGPRPSQTAFVPKHAWRKHLFLASFFWHASKQTYFFLLRKQVALLHSALVQVQNPLRGPLSETIKNPEAFSGSFQTGCLCWLWLVSLGRLLSALDV